MPLVYNGTTIASVFYNGVEIDTLIHNGVTVYESYVGFNLGMWHGGINSSATVVGIVTRISPSNAFIAENTPYTAWTGLSYGSGVGGADGTRGAWNRYVNTAATTQYLRIINSSGGAVYNGSFATTHSRYAATAPAGDYSLISSGLFFNPNEGEYGTTYYYAYQDRVSETGAKIGSTTSVGGAYAYKEASPSGANAMFYRGLNSSSTVVNAITRVNSSGTLLGTTYYGYSGDYGSGAGSGDGDTVATFYGGRVNNGSLVYADEFTRVNTSGTGLSVNRTLAGSYFYSMFSGARVGFEAKYFGITETNASANKNLRSFNSSGTLTITTTIASATARYNMKGASAM